MHGATIKKRFFVLVGNTFLEPEKMKWIKLSLPVWGTFR